jgi:hypothetical protein
MNIKVNTLSAGRPSRNGKAATLASLADTGAMKRVNFELSAEEHTKLKVYAARQGKSVKELLTEYVAQLKE